MIITVYLKQKHIDKGVFKDTLLHPLVYALHDLGLDGARVGTSWVRLGECAAKIPCDLSSPCEFDLDFQLVPKHLLS